jgi:hypothetical protein
MEDWAEIRRLHRAESMPVRAIARRLEMGRNMVRRALAAEGPPKYQRPLEGSIADGAEPRIRELLAQWPDLPATVIAERIGWDRSLTVLKVRVRELRPLFIPPDPASRTQYRPGELAQCGLWFPPADVPLGAGQAGRPPVHSAFCTLTATGITPGPARAQHSARQRAHGACLSRMHGDVHVRF